MSRPAAILLDVIPILNPPLVSADQADLADDEPVFGVVMGDEPRAYQRAAFADVPSHVVHDSIGAHSLIVTHCPRDACTRIFVSQPGKTPEVRLGGWRHDQTMDLIVGRRRFSQRSREIPLDEYAFVEVPWAVWKRRYPTTSVYRLPRIKADAPPAFDS
jgi:hypothetical protein